MQMVIRKLWTVIYWFGGPFARANAYPGSDPLIGPTRRRHDGILAARSGKKVTEAWKQPGSCNRPGSERKIGTELRRKRARWLHLSWASGPHGVNPGLYRTAYARSAISPDRWQR